MPTLWFILVAGMLIMYVLLDGFDLGAGIIHLLVARSNNERRLVLLAIGPVWDGNEVWLIAAAGTLFFTFPLLYASSFSGFYLPLIIVLWLLMGRGVAIELRRCQNGKRGERTRPPPLARRLADHDSIGDPYKCRYVLCAAAGLRELHPASLGNHLPTYCIGGPAWCGLLQCQET